MQMMPPEAAVARTSESQISSSLLPLDQRLQGPEFGLTIG
jgi:hypothetical protein